MRKAFLIPPETFKETLPIRFKSILSKVKSISWKKNIPIIIDFPKNVSKEDFITLTNIHLVEKVLSKNSFIKTYTPHEVNISKMRIYKIKPNIKFLPITVTQKLLVGASIISIIGAVASGILFVALPAIIGLIAPFATNYISLERFSWWHSLGSAKKGSKPLAYDDEYDESSIHYDPTYCALACNIFHNLYEDD